MLTSVLLGSAAAFPLEINSCVPHSQDSGLQVFLTVMRHMNSASCLSLRPLTDQHLDPCKVPSAPYRKQKSGAIRQ